MPALAELGGLIRDEGVTWAYFSAGLFNEVLDERADDLRGLRMLFRVGEALSVGDVGREL